MGGIDDLLLPELCIYYGGKTCLAVWSEAVDFYTSHQFSVNSVVRQPTLRGRTVCDECGCAEFSGICVTPGNPDGSAIVPFQSPRLDLQPWVVPGRWETEEFTGVRVAPGTELALRPSFVSTAGDEFTAGLIECGKATLVGSFEITGLTAKAVRFGYQWFQKTLRPGGCACGCADVTLAVWSTCGERRYLRNAQVTDWQVNDEAAESGFEKDSSCRSITVDVTWEVEDARLWKDPVMVHDSQPETFTINLADTTRCDACRPVTSCQTPESRGLTAVPYSEDRARRGIDLRSDGSWCTTEEFPSSQLQVFGGGDIAEVRATTKVEEGQGAADCALYGIRIILDRTEEPVLDPYRSPIPNTATPDITTSFALILVRNNRYPITLFAGQTRQRFETVRWHNESWNAIDPLESIPCECPLKIVELVTITDEATPEPNPTALQVTGMPWPNNDVLWTWHRKFDVQPYTPSGEDTCFINLKWLYRSWGTWEGMGVEPRTTWVTNDPEQYDYTAGYASVSGWPPAGCKLVVRRKGCDPQATTGACMAAETRLVSLTSNGKWTPVGWHYDAETAVAWPPPNAVFSFINQVETPVVRYTYQETGVSGPCDAPGCLQHPALDAQLPGIGCTDWCEPVSLCVYPTLIPATLCEGSATLRVTVGAGDSPLGSLRWAVYPRVTAFGDLTTAASRRSYEVVEPVAVGEVPALDTGQVIVFDGAEKRVYLNCPLSGTAESEGAAFGPSGLYQHPTLDGGSDYLFAVMPHPWMTATNAFYKLEIIPWEAV